MAQRYFFLLMNIDFTYQIQEYEVGNVFPFIIFLIIK